MLDNIKTCNWSFGEVFESYACLEQFEPDANWICFPCVLKCLSEFSKMYKTHCQFVIVTTFSEYLACLILQFMVYTLLSDHFPVHVDVVIDELIKIKWLI